MLSHRSKNNKSLSILPNHNIHNKSKTIFDWKKHLMNKHNHPNFSELTLDKMDVEMAKKKYLKKNQQMVSSLDKFPAKD